jgi:hypothetical protein
MGSPKPINLGQPVSVRSLSHTPINGGRGHTQNITALLGGRGSSLVGTNGGKIQVVSFDNESSSSSTSTTTTKMNTQQNLRYANSVTGYRGVTVKKSKSITRYQSKLYINVETTLNLGRWDTALEAAQAYDKAAFQDGRPLNKLNFPDEWEGVDRPTLATPTKSGSSSSSTTTTTTTTTSSSSSKRPSSYKKKKGKKRKKSKDAVGYRGVYQIGRRFRASITIDRKTVSLGTYGTAKKAALAWDRGVVKFGRPKEYLNFKEGEVPSSDEDDDSEEDGSDDDRNHKKRRTSGRKHKKRRTSKDTSSDDDEDRRDWFGRKVSQYQQKKSRNQQFVINI